MCVFLHTLFVHRMWVARPFSWKMGVNSYHKTCLPLPSPLCLFIQARNVNSYRAVKKKPFLSAEPFLL